MTVRREVATEAHSPLASRDEMTHSRPLSPTCMRISRPPASAVVVLAPSPVAVSSSSSPPHAASATALAPPIRNQRRLMGDTAVVPFDSSFAPGPKQFDFDVNQISITPERAKAVDFSQGYDLFGNKDRMLEEVRAELGVPPLRLPVKRAG